MRPRLVWADVVVLSFEDEQSTMSSAKGDRVAAARDGRAAVGTTSFPLLEDPIPTEACGVRRSRSDVCRLPSSPDRSLGVRVRLSRAMSGTSLKQPA